jgi:nitroreductase
VTRDDTAPSALPVIDAVTGRRSVRRFLPAPVPNATIAAILTAASRAASGTNFQPWLVHIAVGASRDRVSAAVLAAAEAGETCPEYRYEPEIIPEPYLSRRRKVGFDLYALYGIERHDIAARKGAMLRNFDFFGAPVGLFFTMDRAMTQGNWLDCGMFMQNVMIVARAYGLETCPQQAWCDFGGIVHRELAIPDEHILLSGMALGYADTSAIENGLVSQRAAAGDFTIWHA